MLPISESNLVCILQLNVHHTKGSSCSYVMYSKDANLSKLLCRRCVYSDHETPQFDFLLPTAADNYYLVPFLDLLNHSSDAKVKAAFNSTNNHFEITTYKTCKSHNQVGILFIKS